MVEEAEVTEEMAGVTEMMEGIIVVVKSRWKI